VCVAVCCSVLLTLSVDDLTVLLPPVLQCGAVCCSVLQCVLVCVAVRCSALQCVAACCSVLQSVAECCSVLQCVASCCNMLQCVAVCCNALQCVDAIDYCASLCVWGKVGEQDRLNYTSFLQKEPCKRDNILQKRTII